MQLGNILAGATQPVVCKPVAFHVLGVGVDGKQVKVKAEAVFRFVDEAEREDLRRKSRAYLEDKDYKGQSVPADAAREEYLRYFLMSALRDKDDPARAFCPEGEYSRFRAALIREQVLWLHSAYDQFVSDEYPELLTEEQQKDLSKQAAGNS